MLVLTRKVQEQIKVGNDITITIIRVKGQSVRVGIEAPREVRVMRSELSEGRVNDLSAEPLTHETDASVPARHEESMHDESLAPNPDRAESDVPLVISNRLTSGVQQESAGEVVGPRRLVAPRTGPLSKRVTRQAVVEMLELAN